MFDNEVWLSEREQQAWRAIVLMRGPLWAEIGRVLTKDSGLSLADYDVLVALSEAPDGVLHVQDLLRSTTWEASRMSHQLTRMQARGLLDRRSCPADGRSSEVFLTPSGRAAIEAAAPGHVAAVRRTVVDRLRPEHLDALIEIGNILAVRQPPPACHPAVGE